MYSIIHSSTICNIQNMESNLNAHKKMNGLHIRYIYNGILPTIKRTKFVFHKFDICFIAFKLRFLCFSFYFYFTYSEFRRKLSTVVLDKYLCSVLENSVAFNIFGMRAAFSLMLFCLSFLTMFLPYPLHRMCKCSGLHVLPSCHNCKDSIDYCQFSPFFQQWQRPSKLPGPMTGDSDWHSLLILLAVKLGQHPPLNPLHTGSLRSP